MTTPALNNESENWQGLYSPTESRWQDLRRMGKFVIPIVILIFLSMIYIVLGYTFIHIENWGPDVIDNIAFYIYSIRIILVLSFPLILGATGLAYIFQHAKKVLSVIYQPDTEERLSPLIRRRLMGIPPFPPPLDSIIKYPFIIFKEPSLEEKHWAHWLGGPATLVIYDGIALYLERGNKFSRVVGPGMPMPLLERYERIIEVVDLRPQIRTGYVEPWTKDGIHIKLVLKAEFQIYASPDAMANSARLRYPFDPHAVKKAVEYATVKLVDGHLQASSWLDGAWGNITGEVNAFVAGHSLDELFLEPHANNLTPLNHYKKFALEEMEQILSRKISETVLKNVQPKLNNNGIKVSNIQITEVNVRKEVQDLRTKYWESMRDIVSAQRNSRAEAERIRIRELAHADAQRTILAAITQKLEYIDPDEMTEPLVLSLSSILDQGLEDPLIRPWIASESFAALEKMNKLIKNNSKKTKSDS